MPNLTGPEALIEARAKLTHEVLSKLLIAAVALHAAGALKHHLIDRDGVQSRMLPFGARDTRCQGRVSHTGNARGAIRT